MARKPADQSVNKEDILIAAADLLIRNGYEATTMKDIAAQVNLTAASLYHHFRNKDTLLLAVLETGLEHAIGQLETIVERDISNAEKLREMVRFHVMSIADNKAVGAAMVFEIRALMNAKIDPTTNGDEDGNASHEYIERRDAFFARRDYFERLFQDVVKAGIDAREFREVDPAILVKTMLGAQNWIGVWFKQGGRLTGEEVANQMADIFLTSLLNRKDAKKTK